MNPVISRTAFDGVLFDLDGVVTRTADLHLEAWKGLFDPFLRQRAAAAGTEFIPFTAEDYRRYVDGKPRYEGVSSFLSARGIDLPAGESEGAEEQETVRGLGNRKNRLFQELLKWKGPEVFATSLQLIRTLRDRDFRIGLVSSSRNLVLVVETAGLVDCFDIRVDGVEIDALKLRGKPEPDAFLLAAEKMGVQPGRCVVVEDSRAGVEAGRRGGFGMVIGVSRQGDSDSLFRGGADVVVADLEEIRVEGAGPGPTMAVAELPSALGNFEEIGALLSRRQAAVFFDYDGTLTSIVTNPREAVLSKEMQSLVARLARLAPVAVISGRDLPDIRHLMGLENLYYAGSHGFDIAGPAGGGISLQMGSDLLPSLDHAQQELAEQLSGLAGIRLERKKFALAVHFREADAETVSKLGPIVEGVLGNHPELRASGGKKIIEFRPGIEWDKGRALWWLLERLGLNRPKALPIYMGDDLTDEDAFRILREEGIGIVVSDGQRPTAARYRLDDTAQVREFLERLVRLLDKVKS